MIEGCATYRAGVALPDTDTPAAAVTAAAQGHGRLLWIGLNDPSEEECERLGSIAHLPPPLITALADPHPRTALQRHGDGWLLTAGVARYDQVRDLVEIGTLTAVVRPGALITVTRHVPVETQAVRHRLEAQPGALARGPSFVVWELLEAAVAGYGQVLRDLRGDVEVVERSVFSPDTPAGITQRIYLLKREVIDFQQASEALVDPVEDLAGGTFAVEGDDGVPDWPLLRDQLMRVRGQAEGVGTLLTGILTAYQTDVAIQQNEDMRKISAYVAMAVVPTLVAGIYSMRFEHMPEIDLRFGYPMALGIMAVICVTLYVLFRRKHWL